MEGMRVIWKGMSQMKRKYANLPNWPRIRHKRFGITYFNDEDFKGYATIVYLDKVTRPLKIKLEDRELCLVDDGYIWTQHFPKHAKHALTTMFNREREVVEWYFDICLGNKMSYNGIPYYDDLFLDVVVLPTGEIDLLDEDELKQALQNEFITKGQYDMAYAEAYELMDSVKSGKNKLIQRSKEDLKNLIMLDVK